MCGCREPRKFIFIFMYRTEIIVVFGKWNWVNVCGLMMMTTVKSRKVVWESSRAREFFVKRVRTVMSENIFGIFLRIDRIFLSYLFAIRDCALASWTSSTFFCLSIVPVNLFYNFHCVFRPTFKTLTPTSRTQLKQQLQREQLLQEAERKEAERKALQQQQHQQQKQNEDCKVPLQSIGVDVPQQILQVCSSIKLGDTENQTFCLGPNKTCKSDSLSRHSEAEKSSETISERIL